MSATSRATSSERRRVRERLDAVGYVDVALVAETGIGIMDVARPVGRGRRPPTVAVEHAAERTARLRAKEADRGRRRRERDRAQKEALGVYRGRGRPKRSA